MTTDRLSLIRALCVENLAKAAKRTQGKWQAKNWTGRGTDSEGWNVTSGMERSKRIPVYSRYGGCGEPDAAYIAACAVAAEAGWKATVETIDLCAELKSKALPTSWDFNVATAFENSIIEAWKEQE